MLRLPHENYIRFLITTGLDHDETNSKLEDLGLNMCSNRYWDTQYDLLKNSRLPNSIKRTWSKPHARKSDTFLKFMSSIGLKEAWEHHTKRKTINSKAFSIVMDCLKDTDVSVLVKCMIAMKSPTEEISALINSKFVIPFPPKSVEIFKRYFFNPGRMDRTSWKIYLSSLQKEEKRYIHLAISGQDKLLRTELDLPLKISISEHYQQLHMFAMDKFNKFKDGGEGADAKALKWAQLAMSAGDKYEKLKLSDASDFGRDLQMEFDTIESDFPMIGDDELEDIKQAKTKGTAGHTEEDDDEDE